MKTIEGNEYIEGKNTAEVLKALRKYRLANKNQWIYCDLRLPGKAPLLLKAFNLSIQLLRKNGIRYPDGFDLSAKRYDELVAYALEN